MISLVLAWVKLKPMLIRILEKETAMKEEKDTASAPAQNREKRISELHKFFVQVVALPKAKALTSIEKKLLELYPKLISLPTAWKLVTQNDCSTPITLAVFKEHWPYIHWELKRDMRSLIWGPLAPSQRTVSSSSLVKPRDRSQRFHQTRHCICHLLRRV